MSHHDYRVGLRGQLIWDCAADPEHFDGVNEEQLSEITVPSDAETDNEEELKLDDEEEAKTNINVPNANIENQEETKDEEEEDDEYGDEDAASNSFIELYFQPENQYPYEQSFKIRNMLEILAPIIDEKMFDELRTK